MFSFGSFEKAKKSPVETVKQAPAAEVPFSDTEEHMFVGIGTLDAKEFADVLDRPEFADLRALVENYINRQGQGGDTRGFGPQVESLEELRAIIERRFLNQGLTFFDPNGENYFPEIVAAYSQRHLQ